MRSCSCGRLLFIIGVLIARSIYISQAVNNKRLAQKGPGKETTWPNMLWAHPVMTMTQSGLGLLVSGSSAQLPQALSRLPESLCTTQKTHTPGRSMQQMRACALHGGDIHLAGVADPQHGRVGSSALRVVRFAKNNVKSGSHAH